MNRADGKTNCKTCNQEITLTWFVANGWSFGYEARLSAGPKRNAIYCKSCAVKRADELTAARKAATA